MTAKTLPDLTVRAHDLHDAVFRVAGVNLAYQSFKEKPLQARGHLDRMESELMEVRRQVTRMQRAIRAHRKERP